MTIKLKLLGTLSAALLLAGCDGAGGGGAGGAVANGLSSLGSAFTSMFRADENGTPVDAQSVSLTVDATGDPFNP